MTAAAPPQAPTGPAIVFVDERHGFAAGAGGIVATRDGGRRWRLEFRGHVQALEAADATHAWAIGGPTLLRTTDGVHWRVVSHPGLVAVDFVGRRRGYGLDQQGHLETSANGGVGWSRVRAPQAQALCATVTGIWLARNESIWRRVGRGWTRTLAVPVRWALPDLRCRGPAIWALFHHGAAAGSEGYDVYRSLDAGRSWRRVLADLLVIRNRKLPHISAYSGPFDVVGAGNAVFTGAYPGVVVVTRDGGESWHRTALLSGNTPEAVSFLTLLQGWLIARSPRGTPIVWKTTDGGRHWGLVLRSRVLAVAPP